MAYVISEDCIPCLNCIPNIEIQYCYGSRYNFKKGMEHCPHTKDCKHAKALLDFYKINGHRRPEVEPFFFDSVKKFRRCKKYLEVGVSF